MSPKFPDAQIGVLIAEDHLIARMGVRAIIDAEEDMRVVAEATNGQQAVELFKQHTPDITLMDMRMPGLSGFDAIAGIRKISPQARIIALSTYGGDEDIRKALQVGAQTYLTKDVLYDELLGAIRAIHKGEPHVSTPVAAALAAQSSQPDLTEREIEVLGLIVQGLSNKKIAFALDIAEFTVKNHVRHILTKLDANDRTHAATEAIQRGIVHLK